MKPCTEAQDNVLKLENDLVADSDLDTVAAQIGDSIIGAKFRNMSGELVYNPTH